MLNVLTIQVGMIEENCYIVYGADKGSSAAGSPSVIIDPGEEPDRILGEMSALGLVPEAILLTHAHFDHIGAVDGIMESCPELPIYAYKEEKIIIDNPGLGSLGRRAPSHRWADSVSYLEDRAELDLLGAKWQLLATPGHTAGSCCWYIQSEKLLFAGDTLFAGSCGRTDLPTGSMRSIVNSIQNILAKLPDDTMVLPGHMQSTCIGAEKKYNFVMRM